MGPVTVLRVMLPLVVVCLLQAEGWGAAGYDACKQEEKRLRAAEAEDCSGMSYIFNPSGCFITRKTLVPYDKGKCREIAAREGVVVQKVEPVKTAPVARQEVPAAVPAVTAGVPPLPQSPSLTPVEKVAVPLSDLEQLRREVAELKAELQRLKEQVNTFRQK